jgi:hypothetical protein
LAVFSLYEEALQESGRGYGRAEYRKLTKVQHLLRVCKKKKKSKYSISLPMLCQKHKKRKVSLQKGKTKHED